MTLPSGETSSQSSPAQPSPVRPTLGSFALVFVGGAVGTAARARIDAAVDSADAASRTGARFLDGVPLQAGLPLHTLAINVVGSLLLGILLEHLARRDRTPGRARLRLLLGTGALGGFTTYSALSLTTAELLLDGRPGAATAYGVGSVVLGLLAASAGIALSARVGPSTDRQSSDGDRR